MTLGVSDSVRQLSSDLDSWRDTVNAADDKQIVQALRDIEMLSRAAHSMLLDVVAEVESRGIAAREGFGSTARLMAATLRLSAAEARTRVEHAALVGARRSLTGQVLTPQAPATAAGLAAGQIGTGQLRVIAETMAALPASVPGPVRERAESDLAGYARDYDPRRLRLLATRMLANLDPDGPEPAHDDPSPATPVRGELWLRDRRDGGLGLEGWLDPEHGALVRNLIEQLAAPHPAADGVPDDRSTPARQADALIELCDRARACEDFPTRGGEPPHLTVTIDWEALRTGLGAATLDYGQQISAADARRLACDCALIPVVLGSAGEPLDVGRIQRSAPRGIRRALTARDGGCRFPGCHRPPSLCTAHHIQHWADGPTGPGPTGPTWADGGPTSLGNCCLLCPMHHQQVHLQGWDVTISGSRVEFRPPAIIDPDRKPLINPLRR